MARYESGSLSPLQAGLPGFFLDLGSRLRAAHLCRWRAAPGDLAVPESNRRCVLFPAFPGGAAARWQVRTPAATPVQHWRTSAFSFRCHGGTDMTTTERERLMKEQ